ncbi:PhzF family phenazine biosynthesis protein [Aliiroseovarius sp. 2305UL8-7]|uniref:PhzF family phenazine biosynthesis protein n=1 Tax=Aliiroseovarius conchicola TaxID=3121637 RepID=UPI003527C0B7
MRDFFVYDVFTETPFGGNQLAVLPDASGLGIEDIQKIAREFNFSETTFVLPPENAAHTARVRIFTPERELPFAGHPIVGTAVMLADIGYDPDMVLELEVGPLPAHASEGEASFVTDHALERKGHPAPDLVARAIGCSVDDIVQPPEIASLGGDFVYAQLRNRQVLSTLQANADAMREGVALFPGNHDFAIYAWVEHEGAIHARMFAPLDGIPEDPATGSAAAPLAALLCQDRGCDQSLIIHQGDDMGRPSRIHLKAEPGRVTVSGHAVQIMKGQLLV